MGDFIGDLTGLVAVLMPVFIVWIIFSSKSRSNQAGKLSQEESTQLDELNEMAEKMAERIKTLETILDAETPEWRNDDA